MTLEQVQYIRDELLKGHTRIAISFDNEHQRLLNTEQNIPKWDDERELIIFVNPNHDVYSQRQNTFNSIDIIPYDCIQEIKSIINEDQLIEFVSTNINEIKSSDVFNYIKGLNFGLVHDSSVEKLKDIYNKIEKDVHPINSYEFLYRASVLDADYLKSKFESAAAKLCELDYIPDTNFIAVVNTTKRYISNEQFISLLSKFPDNAIEYINEKMSPILSEHVEIVLSVIDNIKDSIPLPTYIRIKNAYTKK